MQKTKTLLTALLIIIFSINVAGAKKKSLIKKKKIAVLEMDTNNVASFFSDIVRTSIEISLFNSDKFEIIDRMHIKRASRRLNISIKNNNSSTAMKRLGQKLSTDFIINGSIDKIDSYRLTLRVISIKMGRIITVYTRTFSSSKDIDYVIEKMVDDISRDIHKFIKKGYVRSRFFEHHNMYLGFKLNYFYPMGDFNQLINPAPGYTVFTELDNIIFDYTTLGFEFSYYRFTGEENSTDTLTMVPIMINLGYKMHPLKKLYLKPHLSMGVNLISLTHGDSEGFEMNENSEEHSAEPMAAAGINIGIIPTYDINIEWGATYGIIFESKQNIKFTNLSLAILFNF